MKKISKLLQVLVLSLTVLSIPTFAQADETDVLKIHLKDLASGSCEDSLFCGDPDFTLVIRAAVRTVAPAEEFWFAEIVDVATIDLATLASGNMVELDRTIEIDWQTVEDQLNLARDLRAHRIAALTGKRDPDFKGYKKFLAVELREDGGITSMFQQLLAVDSFLPLEVGTVRTILLKDSADSDTALSSRVNSHTNATLNFSMERVRRE